MIAATAVGVSHLVQSTRAGADYGLSLSLAIVLIVLLKYPTFRFAAVYSSSTGRSLVAAYANQGRVALGWLLLAMLIEMFVGTPAVALVVAGVLVSVFDLTVPVAAAAIAVIAVTALVLLSGSYVRVEKLIKILVVSFSAVTLMATALAIPKLGSSGIPVFEAPEPNLGLLAFLIAMTGWMPLPVAVSMFHSVWVREKVAATRGGYTMRHALFDLNFGWALTLVLALCFVIMGTAVLFDTGTEMPTSAARFATLLFSLFTTLSGNWVYPILAIGGIAVIWSTLVAIMDAVPRLTERLYLEWRASDVKEAWLFRVFLAVQAVGASLVLLLFLDDFRRFIDFAASTGFLVAPAIAWFNYRAVRSREVSGEYSPNRAVVAWHWASIICFVLFAGIFFMIHLD